MSILNKIKQRNLVSNIAILILISTLTDLVLAQKPEPLAANSAEIEVLPVQGNLYMIGTGGSNIAVMVGELGLVVVDSGNIEASDNVVDAIRSLSPLLPRYIINTAVLPGHLSGNSAIGAMLPPDTRGGFGMSAIGHANGLTLLATEFVEEVPFELWPNNTFFGESKDLNLNGEAILIEHQPEAVTQSDVMVYFRQSDVLVTGDIFDISSYPHFYPELGDSLQGMIDALNRIIEITVPEFNQQGGTLVIPGHGRIASESDVVEYRDMLTIIRDRVRLMINDGKTFDEVLAARPSLEYDGIYGAGSRNWTTHMFLEAVYDDLR